MTYFNKGNTPRSTHSATAPKRIVAGTVNTHERKIRAVTPHRTADRRRTDPTPRMDEVMACVVLIGIPSSDAPRMTAEPAVSAANPWTGSSAVIRSPSVRMMRQPPYAVPNAASDAQLRTIHTGTVTSFHP